MKKLLVPFCLTLIIFIGRVGVSESANLQKGNAKLQYKLGLKYQYWTGVPRDYKTAMKLFKIAAKQGYIVAQGHLDSLYSGGRGIPQDCKTAMKWYRLTAEQENEYAMYTLCLMHALHKER